MERQKKPGWIWIGFWLCVACGSIITFPVCMYRDSVVLHENNQACIRAFSSDCGEIIEIRRRPKWEVMNFRPDDVLIEDESGKVRVWAVAPCHGICVGEVWHIRTATLTDESLQISLLQEWHGAWRGQYTRRQ